MGNINHPEALLCSRYLWLNICREPSKFIDTFPSKCEYTSTSTWVPNDLHAVPQNRDKHNSSRSSQCKNIFYFLYWCSTCFVPCNENKLQRLCFKPLGASSYHSSQQHLKILINIYKIIFLLSFKKKLPQVLPSERFLGTRGSGEKEMARSELPLQSRAASQLAWAQGSFASVGPFLHKRLKIICHDCLNIKTNVIIVLPTESALLWRSQGNDWNKKEGNSQRNEEEVTLSLGSMQDLT